MVQPKIDSLHEAARDVAVIVLHENDASFQTWFAAELVNLLNKRFACFILWMRFACKDELYWARRIVHQTFESFLIAKQKCATLVGREPPRETDGQNFGIKNAIDSAN